MRGNAICERIIGTLRREVLDRLLIVNQHQLRQVITEYLPHYNTGRTVPSASSHRLKPTPSRPNRSTSPGTRSAGNKSLADSRMSTTSPPYRRRWQTQVTNSNHISEPHTMLAHAYLDRIGAAAILAAALPPALARPRYDDLGLLTATSLAFALGASSAEGTRHLIPAQAGILAGIGRLPGPRTLRPRLAAIADRCDPLALQRQLAAAMLAAGAPGLHVYYADDHFVPYEGAKPVPKGWNTKRRHAQPGRAGTMVTDYQGRAVAFATGEPSGLSATLPPVLAQLRQVLGAEAKIMLGFDRGGSYPVAFRAIREQHAGWVTWRRGPLATVTAAPRRYWAAAATASPPRCSGWPMRAWRSRTTARPGRSPCSRTAARCCRCSPATPMPRPRRCWPGCAAGGGPGTCSSTWRTTTASTGCGTTTPAPKTTTT
jgi:hypothetical protein